MIINQPNVLVELEGMKKGQNLDEVTAVTEILELYSKYQKDLEQWQIELKNYPIVLAKEILGGKKP